MTSTCASPLNDRSVYPLYVLPLLTILFGVLLYVLLVLTNGNGNGNSNSKTIAMATPTTAAMFLMIFLFVLFWCCKVCATQILCTLMGLQLVFSEKKKLSEYSNNYDKNKLKVVFCCDKRKYWHLWMD